MKLYVKNNFVSQDICAKLMASQVHSNAKVFTKSGSVELNEEIRKTFRAEIPIDIRKELNDLIEGIKDELNEFFSLTLNKFEPIQHLRYEQGHFFSKHTDHSVYDSLAKDRLLTVLIYINSSDHYVKEPNSFSGGELIIYGLHEKFPNRGMPIFAQAGKIVAFPSQVVHEVTPITSGQRSSLVTWFH